MTFNAGELEQLRAPFPLAAHTVREGHRSKNGKKIRWFVYIERSEVQDRLEAVFPLEWGTERPELHIQSNKVSAVVGITIRGVTRWDGGEDDSNEGTKGALTNAFRRTAAYGWHVGRYLYDMDVEIWTESYEAGNWDDMKARKQDAFNKFTEWYKKQFANAQKPAPSVGIPPQPTTTAEPPQNAGNTPSNVFPDWFNTPVEKCWGAFKQYILKDIYTNNPYHMNGSLKKYGITSDLGQTIDAKWNGKSAKEVVEYLQKARTQELAEAS